MSSSFSTTEGKNVIVEQQQSSDATVKLPGAVVIHAQQEQFSATPKNNDEEVHGDSSPGTAADAAGGVAAQSAAVSTTNARHQRYHTPHQLYLTPPHGGGHYPYYSYRYHHPHPHQLQDPSTAKHSSFGRGQHLHHSPPPPPPPPPVHPYPYYPTQPPHYGYASHLPPPPSIPYAVGSGQTFSSRQYSHHQPQQLLPRSDMYSHQHQQHPYDYGGPKTAVSGSSPILGAGVPPTRASMEVYHSSQHHYQSPSKSSPGTLNRSRNDVNSTPKREASTPGENKDHCLYHLKVLPSTTKQNVGSTSSTVTPAATTTTSVLPTTPSGEEYCGEVEADLAALPSPTHSQHNITSCRGKRSRSIIAVEPNPQKNEVVTDGGIKQSTSADEIRLVTLDELNLDRWFMGCLPLGLEDDKYWLSELQVYLRSNFAEVFSATDQDTASVPHGRNKPILLGQVGVRCRHCKHLSPAERGQQATSYPSLISGIYNSVQQMLRLHLECCQSMPLDVINRINALKASSSNRGGRKEYWADSARRIGLVDTAHGIYFGRDPYGPLPQLIGLSVIIREGRKKNEQPPTKKQPDPPPPAEMVGNFPPAAAPVDDRKLVFPEDEHLISDFLFLGLSQMVPCSMVKADLVGCYKNRNVGEPGLACRHCVGHAGCGRYFPASEASLSQTTTSQTIINHVRNCRRCPIEIRENIETMKRARTRRERKRSDKPKHGGRKLFFHRLWCRIQGLPIQDGDWHEEYHKPENQPKVPLRKNMVDSSFGDFSPITHRKPRHEDASDSFDEDNDADRQTATTRGRSLFSKKKTALWYDGCVRLSKSDDEKFLPELECFARNVLVEVFSFGRQDGLHGYTGRKEVSVGQVGIRCVFSKMLPEEERPAGSLEFPESLETISTKVGGMLRLHFSSCSAIPDSIREKFNSLKEGTLMQHEETNRYWVDSARDIGLRNVLPTEKGWGVRFGRDPLLPSPSDELDREEVTGKSPNLPSTCLVRNSDRGEITDQTLLMMRQVKVATFEERDIRGGSSSTARNRALHYPGLGCKYCMFKSSSGRHFPTSHKNLTDNTANALMTHVSSCKRVPEHIKASLAYLGHRAALQKSSLGGSWTKEFYRKIWDRLHNDRDWMTAVADDDTYDEASDDEDEERGKPKEASAGIAVARTASAKGFFGGDEKSDDEDTPGDNMNALIKAAAIWLTEQDEAGDNASGGGSTSCSPSRRKRTTTWTYSSSAGRSGDRSRSKRRRTGA